LEARLEISTLDYDYDLSVQVTQSNSKKIFRINAEPTETLQHYADWLKMTDVEMVRELNEETIRETLSIGDVLLLPISSNEQKAFFEQQRQDYHRMLVSNLKKLSKYCQFKITLFGQVIVYGLSRSSLICQFGLLRVTILP
jgi:hypothetical protein